MISLSQNAWGQTITALSFANIKDLRMGKNLKPNIPLSIFLAKRKCVKHYEKVQIGFGGPILKH